MLPDVVYRVIGHHCFDRVREISRQPWAPAGRRGEQGAIDGNRKPLIFHHIVDQAQTIFPALPDRRRMQGGDIEFDAGRGEIDPQPMHNPAPLRRGPEHLAPADDTGEYLSLALCRASAPGRQARPYAGG